MRQDRCRGVSGQCLIRLSKQSLVENVTRFGRSRQVKSPTENSTKIASARIPAVGASTLAPWVGPNRSDRQVLTTPTFHVGRRRWEANRCTLNCAFRAIEPELWPGSIYKDRMRWPTHINGLAAAIRNDIAPAHRHTRNAPCRTSDAAALNGPYCSLQPFHVVW